MNERISSLFESYQDSDRVNKGTLHILIRDFNVSDIGIMQLLQVIWGSNNYENPILNIQNLFTKQDNTLHILIKDVEKNEPYIKLIETIIFNLTHENSESLALNDFGANNVERENIQKEESFISSHFEKTSIKDTEEDEVINKPIVFKDTMFSLRKDGKYIATGRRMGNVIKEAQAFKRWVLEKTGVIVTMCNDNVTCIVKTEIDAQLLDELGVIRV